MESESEFIQHEPCPECGSKDNLARYTDGHAYCFGCGHHENGDGTPRLAPAKRSKDLLPADEFVGLGSRKITEQTARKFGYFVTHYAGKPVQVAPYYDAEGRMVAQKVRFPDKGFLILGDAKDAMPFGAHVWPKTGKKVVVTEGEIDALTMSQVQGNKWPVVSINCGAGAQTRKWIAERKAYFDGFEEVILMFDNDERGRASAKVAAQVIGSSAKIAELPLKDANDMLVEGRVEELVNAMWRAKEYRPEGIVRMDELLDSALTPPERGLSWPFPTLTDLTFGMRLGELYALGAGTGIGKTDFLTETVAHLVKTHGQKVGYIALEQAPTETALRVAGKLLSKPLHVPDVERTDDEVREAFALADGKVFLYDSFGANEYESIKDKIEYLVHAQGVRWFFLDHLTALAATETDERKALDGIMADLGGLVKKHNITITLISHLATPNGIPHEEGGRVTIRHFRGSRAIGFWCHYIFGIERNQQSEDPVERATSTFRVLKDRYTGRATGSTFHFNYNTDTGRLAECPSADEARGFGFQDEASGSDDMEF